MVERVLKVLPQAQCTVTRDNRGEFRLSWEYSYRSGPVCAEHPLERKASSRVERPADDL